MREHYNDEERQAAALLDAARLGLPVPTDDVVRALWVLGDLVGIVSEGGSWND